MFNAYPKIFYSGLIWAIDINGTGVLLLNPKNSPAYHTIEYKLVGTNKRYQ